jgi:hypothetical protein
MNKLTVWAVLGLLISIPTVASADVSVNPAVAAALRAEAQKVLKAPGGATIGEFRTLKGPDDQVEGRSSCKRVPGTTVVGKNGWTHEVLRCQKRGG